VNVPRVSLGLWNGVAVRGDPKPDARHDRTATL